MRPAQAATQNVGRAAASQVVERVLRPPLPDEERDQGGRETSERGPTISVVSFGTAREVDPEDQRADEHDREDAAEVVDRLGRLVHVARHEQHRHHERDRRERQRQQEDRSPPEVLEQDPGAERPERGDGAAGGRPERDRPRARRARPERRDQREGRRVRHAGRQPAEHPGAEQHVDRSAPRPPGSPRAPSGPSRGSAGACGRSGRRRRRSRAPRRRARASSRPRPG